MSAARNNISAVTEYWRRQFRMVLGVLLFGAEESRQLSNVPRSAEESRQLSNVPRPAEESRELSMAPAPREEMLGPSDITRAYEELTNEWEVERMQTLLSDISSRINSNELIDNLKKEIVESEINQHKLKMLYYRKLSDFHEAAIKTLQSNTDKCQAETLVLRNLDTKNSKCEEILIKFSSMIDKIFQDDDVDEEGLEVLASQPLPTLYKWRPSADGVHRPPIIFKDGAKEEKIKYQKRKFEVRIVVDGVGRRVEVPKHIPYWDASAPKPAALKVVQNLGGRASNLLFSRCTYVGVELLWACRNKYCDMVFAWGKSRSVHENKYDEEKKELHFSLKRKRKGAKLSELAKRSRSYPRQTDNDDDDDELSSD